MPTYEYYCNSCKHHFDIFQKISDAPLMQCPKCGEKSLKRVINGGSGMIFKGSGFYITDYKKTAGKEKEATEKTHVKKEKASVEKNEAVSSHE